MPFCAGEQVARNILGVALVAKRGTLPGGFTHWSRTNADDLTKEQLSKLADDAGACQGYYHRLAARMTQRGFSSADPLLLLTLEAETAAHKLSVALHYRACGQCTGYSYPSFAKPDDSKAEQQPRGTP